jgi:hypothetical protein
MIQTFGGLPNRWARTASSIANQRTTRTMSRIACVYSWCLVPSVARARAIRSKSITTSSGPACSRTHVDFPEQIWPTTT